MKGYLTDAVGELKRVDHLIYVSLKYTRTVDVIKSVVERILNSFDFAILELLEYAKEKKMISEYPNSPGLRVGMLKKLFSENKELLEYLDFYLTLRKVSRAEFTKREEYRRHVTMIANLEADGILEIDIDKLLEYYADTKKFIHMMNKLVEGEND